MYQRMGVHAPFDPAHKLVTSAVFSPLVLALIRSTLAIYTLFSIVFSLAWKGVHLAGDPDSDAGSTFSYFTDLSYIGLCAYFFASAVQTWLYAIGGDKGYPLQKWPRILQFLHLLLLSTIISFPLLVTIVYWILLADARTFQSAYSSWSNISKHLLNAVFALFEILLTRVGPNPWSHTFFLILILAGYLGVAYITYATRRFYVYSFLNPAKQKGFLAAYIVGIPIGEAIVFAVAQGICILRERIIVRCQRNRTHYAPEELDEWQSVESPSDLPMAI